MSELTMDELIKRIENVTNDTSSDELQELWNAFFSDVLLGQLNQSISFIESHKNAAHPFLKTFLERVSDNLREFDWHLISRLPDSITGGVGMDLNHTAPHLLPQSWAPQWGANTMRALHERQNALRCFSGRSDALHTAILTDLKQRGFTCTDDSENDQHSFLIPLEEWEKLKTLLSSEETLDKLKKLPGDLSTIDTEKVEALEKEVLAIREVQKSFANQNENVVPPPETPAPAQNPKPFTNEDTTPPEFGEQKNSSEPQTISKDQEMLDHLTTINDFQKLFIEKLRNSNDAGHKELADAIEKTLFGNKIDSEHALVASAQMKQILPYYLANHEDLLNLFKKAKKFDTWDDAQKAELNQKIDKLKNKPINFEYTAPSNISPPDTPASIASNGKASASVPPPPAPPPLKAPDAKDPTSEEEEASAPSVPTPVVEPTEGYGLLLKASQKLEDVLNSTAELAGDAVDSAMDAYEQTLTSVFTVSGKTVDEIGANFCEECMLMPFTLFAAFATALDKRIKESRSGSKDKTDTKATAATSDSKKGSAPKSTEKEAVSEARTPAAADHEEASAPREEPAPKSTEKGAISEARTPAAADHEEASASRKEPAPKSTEKKAVSKANTPAVADHEEASASREGSASKSTEEEAVSEARTPAGADHEKASKSIQHSSALRESLSHELENSETDCIQEDKISQFIRFKKSGKRVHLFVSCESKDSDGQKTELSTTANYGGATIECRKNSPNQETSCVRLQLNNNDKPCSLHFEWGQLHAQQSFVYSAINHMIYYKTGSRQKRSEKATAQQIQQFNIAIANLRESYCALRDIPSDTPIDTQKHVSELANTLGLSEHRSNQQLFQKQITNSSSNKGR